MDPLFTTKIRVTHTAEILATINKYIAKIPHLGPAMDFVGKKIIQPDPESESNINEFHALIGAGTLTTIGYLLYAGKVHIYTKEDAKRKRSSKRGRDFEQFMRSFNRFSDDAIERGRQIAEQCDLRMQNIYKSALIVYYLTQCYDLGPSASLKEISLKGNLQARSLYRLFHKFVEMLEDINATIEYPSLPPNINSDMIGTNDIFEPDLPPSPPDLSKYPPPSEYEPDDLIESVWDEDSTE